MRPFSVAQFRFKRAGEELSPPPLRPAEFSEQRFTEATSNFAAAAGAVCACTGPANAASTAARCSGCLMLLVSSGREKDSHASIFGRALDVVDDQEFTGTFAGIQLQAELLLQGGTEARACRVGSRARRSGEPALAAAGLEAGVVSSGANSTRRS